MEQCVIHSGGERCPIQLFAEGNPISAKLETTNFAVNFLLAYSNAANDAQYANNAHFAMAAANDEHFAMAA